MSADIQAKYNALLLKFVGDRTIPVDPETEMDIHKDIAQYMHEKNKRIQEQAKASYDAIVASIGEPSVQDARLNAMAVQLLDAGSKPFNGKLTK